MTPQKRKSGNALTAFRSSCIGRACDKNIRRCGRAFLHGFLLSLAWSAVFLIEDEVIQVAPGIRTVWHCLRSFRKNSRPVYDTCRKKRAGFSVLKLFFCDSDIPVWVSALFPKFSVGIPSSFSVEKISRFSLTGRHILGKIRRFPCGSLSYMPP